MVSCALVHIQPTAAFAMQHVCFGLHAVVGAVAPIDPCVHPIGRYVGAMAPIEPRVRFIPISGMGSIGVGMAPTDEVAADARCHDIFFPVQLRRNLNVCVKLIILRWACW